MDDTETITEENLVLGMSRFITEIRKINGEQFLSKTLYEIMMCVQFHLESIGFAWRLLHDTRFIDLKFTLDNIMKEHCRDNVGGAVRKAAVLSEVDIDILWENGYLGDSNHFICNLRRNSLRIAGNLDKAVGINKLQCIVHEVCQSAGLPGFHTNHSLRATATTHIYHSGLDEQLIQEVTGHHSVAVREYKRTCDDQKLLASSCIMGVESDVKPPKCIKLSQ